MDRRTAPPIDQPYSTIFFAALQQATQRGEVPANKSRPNAPQFILDAGIEGDFRH
jgi:hypothetical protein